MEAIEQFGSLQIGLESLGCKHNSVPNTMDCKLMGKCTAQNMSKCMERAMTDFPEVKADIMYASVFIIVNRAKNIEEVQQVMPKIESVLEKVAA